MATNTKNKEWAKSNKEMLMDMLDKGYIALEDLQAINNKDEKFSIEQQDAAFDRVKKDIQSRYSEERLDNTDILNDEEKKAFRTFRQSVDKFDKPTDSLLSSKLIEQINSSGYKDIPLLKGMIGQLKNLSDSDTREYIYNQRHFLDKSLPSKVIENIPDLQEYMTVQPNYGVKNTNYAKMFNDEDILDKLNEYSFRDIDYIARKNGMTGKELLKDLTGAKIAKDRNLAAHGGRWRDVFDADKYNSLLDNPIASNVGGSLLTLFGRRQQEAIARGEEPGLKDIGGDVGEQLAYMAPVGRIAGPVAKVAARIGQRASKVAAATTNVASNAIVPTATELYDKIVYDNDNPRGEFSIADALVGTGVNAIAPFALREAGEGIGKLTGSKNIQKYWGELAEGKSADDIINAAEAEREFIGRNKLRINQEGTAGDLTPEYYKKISSAGDLTDKYENKLMKLLAKENNVTTPNQQAFNMAIKNPSILAKSRDKGNKIAGDYLTIYKKSSNPAYNANLDNIYKYDAKEWSVLTKAMKDGEKTYKWHGEIKEVPDVSELKAALDPKFVEKYHNSPYATSMFLKSNKELASEDAIKNYLTNQFGNFTYADKSINLPGLSMLPIDINQYVKDYRDDKERQKAKEESMRRLPTLQSLYGNIK